MNNVDLLLSHNGCSKDKIRLDNMSVSFMPKFQKDPITNRNLFTGIEISKIIEFVNNLHIKYKGMPIPITFRFGEVIFIDKLTYILLECICYVLINDYRHRVQIYMSVMLDIGTEGIESSPLLLLNNTKNKSVLKFPAKFEWDLYKNHYRKVVKGNSETNYLGELYSEIDSFLKLFSFENDACRDEITQVIVELAGNAFDHCNADCLVDLDVTQEYNGKQEDGKEFCGINIAVVNFSENLLGTGINDNIIISDNNINDDRYRDVLLAYQKHIAKFSETYCKEDFCNITAFQHKISGRGDTGTGGTGLTKLIKSLSDRSSAYRCYVITGKRCVNFYSNLLEYNNDNWIGFNDENNYFNCIPQKDVITECLINMPGTAYNLNFVIEGEKIRNE